MIGAAKASPAEGAASGANTPSGDGIAPPTAATAVKTVTATNIRIAVQPSTPRTSPRPRDRRRHHGVVGAQPLGPGHHRPHRVVRPDLHRRRRDQPGRRTRRTRGRPATPGPRRRAGRASTPTESRKKTGFKNEVVISSRATCAGSCARATRSRPQRGRTASSPIARRPAISRPACARSASEDVLERAAPDEHAPTGTPRSWTSCAVASPSSVPITRSASTSRRSPRSSSWPSRLGVPFAKRSSTTSRCTYFWISSRGEPSATIFAWSMTDEPVAELLGLVHVVGRQDLRPPCCLSR